MDDNRFQIINGPDKPGLQWAVAYPDKQQVLFELPDGPVHAQILHMNERSDGLTFDLQGVLKSGKYDGCRFTGTFEFGSRSGELSIVPKGA